MAKHQKYKDDIVIKKGDRFVAIERANGVKSVKRRGM